MKEKISITLNKKTLEDIDSIIDNVYIRNRSQAIELLVNNALGENKSAVILSGGNEDSLKIGKDYRITCKIGEDFVIELAIKKLREEGFKHTFIIARHNIITEVFKIIQNGSKYGVNIDYIEETTSKGTAESLRFIKGKLKNSFLVVYGDIIFNRINIEELWNAHIKQNGIATLMLTTTPTPNKKGVVKIEGTRILEFEQKPKISDIYLGFSSIFIAQPEILEYHGTSLEEDIFPILAKKGFLQGHLSANKEYHIHTLDDAVRVEKDLRNS
jgi:NDP-sugar pyrophosphorylase family protein